MEGLLGAAGYSVTRQNFSYEQFILNSSAMQQTAPGQVTYAEDVDFAAMSYSGAGDVTAAVQAVDINLAGDRASTSGCEAADFAGFTPGNIALIQRGSCFFRVKVDNAAAAGASAVIVFNQGNVDPNDDRFGLFFGTLDPPVAAIPAVSTTFALGEQLATTAGLQMRVAVDATVRTTNTFNVLADTPGGRADRMVVVGAHLDSVPEGPGINDNGSGTSAILETALQMAELGITPTNKVRFAFWGGEEDGLIGSTYYVSQLSARALKQHAVNLNFDMVGSPNFVRFVYDGDGSAFGVKRAQRVGAGGAGLPRLLRVAGSGDRADRVRRALRLLRLHQQRHPGRRPVHRRRGHQDRRRRPRSMAAPPAPPTTRATTRPATPSPTSATRRSTRCPTPSPTRRSRSR